MDLGESRTGTRFYGWPDSLRLAVFRISKPFLIEFTIAPMRESHLASLRSPILSRVSRVHGAPSTSNPTPLRISHDPTRAAGPWACSESRAPGGLRQAEASLTTQHPRRVLQAPSQRQLPPRVRPVPYAGSRKPSRLPYHRRSAQPRSGVAALVATSSPEARLPPCGPPPASGLFRRPVPASSKSRADPTGRPSLPPHRTLPQAPSAWDPRYLPSLVNFR